MAGEEHSLEVRFEELVARLFERLGFSISRQISKADLLLTSSRHTTAVVEIKLYRSFRISASIIRNAIRQTMALRRRLNANFAILVTAARIDETVRPEVKSDPSFLFYDYDTLSFLLVDFPDLGAEFEKITQEAFAYRSDPLPTPVSIGSERATVYTAKLRAPPPAPGIPEPEPPPIIIGQELCAEIREIQPGKSRGRATLFERRCLSALKYLFGDDFSSWLEQTATVGGLHRFDVVGRISSTNDLWNSLISDFRTRYVIFEMKNYSGRITQAEIYTTEKYLYPPAMRGTAIIVSRKGADKNALAAARGALREAGKLIINLSIDDICEMLHRKDNGDDVYQVIAGRLDEMLIRLER